MSKNVDVVRFTESSKAYQGLSILKELDAQGRIDLDSAAVAERTTDSKLQIPESADNNDFVGMASGSLVGMLIGVLGGPVGALIGFGTGALIGGAFDIDRAVTSDDALTVLGEAIEPGSTVLIANVGEPAVEVIDAEMALIDGEVTRRPTSDVMADLAAAEAAAEAASRKAAKEKLQKHEAEFRADVHEHVGEIKEKLHA
jgi:uncharacterized membrane protein